MPDSEFIWPKPDFNLRPLKEAEIERLESALGKLVERQYLVQWMSQAIADVVWQSSAPSAKEARGELTVLARNGRRWLQQIEACRAPFLLRQSTHFEQLANSAAQFCCDIEAVATRLSASIKAGPPAQVEMDTFLDKMIGITKWARVLPSTPSRAIPPESAPPVFFTFVRVALQTAREAAP